MGAADFEDMATLVQDALGANSSEAFLVRVTDGPDKGASFRVDLASPSRVLVGQSPACECRLNDPKVSRRHLALEPFGARLRVTDLESTNGTFVNGIRIGEAFLAGGESILLGDSVLRVEALHPKTEPMLSSALSFGRYLGASVEMRRLYPLCERIAASNVRCIIEGETGTGKEQLAEALHEKSPRAEAPFVVFDCTAVPANLVEAELFGYEKGAFTGALIGRKGVLEQAQGGTLLIDEIGDLELALQPKLLRVIDRGEIRRLGGDRAIRLDVRILAATRRDLDREVAAGRFRDDLFHRLAIGRIELPPLRRRKGDVTYLARIFAEEFGIGKDGLPPEVLARWEDHTWPGNVRELRNAVARFVALGQASISDTAAAQQLSGDGAGDFVEGILAMKLSLPEARRRMQEEFERRYVERALEAHGGNVSRAAAASGVVRRHFQTIKARVQFDSPDDKKPGSR